MICLRPVVVRVPIGSWLCPNSSGQRRLRSSSQKNRVDFFGIKKSTKEKRKCAFPRDSLSFNYHTKYFTLQEILRSGTEAESGVLKSVLKHMRLNKRDADKRSTTTTGLKKWLVKKLQIDGFTASLCQTSWVTSSGCPGGDYEYIDMLIKDENGEEIRLTVDTDFKSQFELARPTQSYKELTNLIPTIYVGDEKKLNKIISLLCSAAKQSLKDRGLHIPPWRTLIYMQCKWLRRDNGEEPKSGKNGFSGHDWVPPLVVKPKRRYFGGGYDIGTDFELV